MCNNNILQQLNTVAGKWHHIRWKYHRLSLESQKLGLFHYSWDRSSHFPIRHKFSFEIDSKFYLNHTGIFASQLAAESKVG